MSFTSDLKKEIISRGIGGKSGVLEKKAALSAFIRTSGFLGETQNGPSFFIVSETENVAEFFMAAFSEIFHTELSITRASVDRMSGRGKLLLQCPAAFAQEMNGVVVENYTMERSGNYIVVDMDLDVSNLAIRNTEVVRLTPHIVRDTLSKDLRSIGIYGRNRHFYYERNKDLAPTTSDDMYFRSNNTPDKVHYQAVVSFEEWMDGCQLVFEREDCGCGGSVIGKSASLLIDRFPLEPYRPKLIYVRPNTKSEKVYTISGSAYVDFPVSRMEINTEWRNAA